MINTNSIIDNIKRDIQRSIDLEQQKLDNITNAYEKAQQFLLDNGCSQINDDDDVLSDIMKCIKSMKEQMKINDEDIKNIEKSVKALESLKNTVDKSVIESLLDKIKIVKGYNDTSSEKLKESKLFLEPLLSLEIDCPVCGSKRNSNTTRCSYCEGTQVVNVSKILDKESLLEVDYVKPTNTNNTTNKTTSSEIDVNYNNTYDNYNYVDYNQGQKNNTEDKHSSKFVIRKS